MKPETNTPESPAPQLPNFPISPDDPFQPDLERREPVTPPSNQGREATSSGQTQQKKEIENDGD